ncbi:hypothetical protein ABZ412_34240 [Nocardia sp. NPDC005746]|uniref:VG15 protein n=1 Tax=Nocardia sp. NPDC005746 TaxID=3157062 RepID=UPI0033FF86D4
MLASATEFDDAQRKLSVAAIEEIAQQWARTPPRDFDAWFARHVDRLTKIVTAGQAAAVAGANQYVADALDEQGIRAPQTGTPNPARLVGVTADGRTIDGLLAQSVIGARARMAEGMPAYRAWQEAGLEVRRVISNEFADAGRAATGIGIVSRLGVGYVRMLTPPSCSRCVVLAGRYYHWSSGFQRHPNCNCRHIPSREDHADDIRTDPVKYFESLTEAEQAKVFGKAGAQAIRDGADMSQIVNARRGLTIIGGRAQRTEVYGRQLLTTSEGTTRRGVAGRTMRARGRNPRTTPRLMPEAIYEIAETREEALELLRKNGYLLEGAKPRTAAAPKSAAPKPEPAPTPVAEPPAEPAKAPAKKAAKKAAKPAAEPPAPIEPETAPTEPKAPEPKKKARKSSPFAGRTTEDLTATLNAKAEAGEIDEEFDRLAAEIDKRDQRAKVERDRRAAKRDAKAKAQDDKYEQLTRAGVDDEEAIEKAYGVAVPEQRRRNARSHLAGLGYEGKGLDEQVRAWHRDEAHHAWLNAEEATNGYMLSKAGERAGVDPRKLWSMPEDRARKYASEELRGWWDQNGRMTAAELKAQLLDPTELARMQSRRRDFLQ